ncbi:Alpha/Beta hydrolase protein [Papiliotrema laurentii]|uniref:Alpha/Beta hydrolase protein n=1 Tax=Papiliotrema laurentii TaxID=5418 RepID=A0AAD9CSF9_PAPLA|nr:Alpha/Beta hydrolase protein [Papiliotrema laurentii]
MTELTHLTFARHGGVDIKLGYKLPSAPRGKAPILLWFHGGGLLQGTRTCAWSHLLNAPDKHGLCLVSADYRLAPQTRMPGIMEDIAAAMNYVRSPAFLAETHGAVDQSKVIVSGGSAGGWLALLLATGIGFEACGLKPRAPPLAVVPLYPMTDITDRFFRTKQHPVSYFKRVIDPSEVAEYLDPNAPPTSESMLDSPRSKCYPFMVQEAIEEKLLLEGTGLSAEVFSIAPNIASGKFALPPAYFVHGTIDDKVPIRQSEEVVAAARARGLEVEFEVMEGVDHLFDMDEKYQVEGMYRFIEGVCGRV